MKILMLLSEEFPPDKRVENEINYLAQAGHKVVVACYTRKGKPLFQENSQYKTYRLAISTIIYKSMVAILTVPIYYNVWKRFVKDIIAKENPDAIHVHDLPLVKLANYFKTKNPNLLVVADMHENYPDLVKESEHTNTFLGKILSPVCLWRRFESKQLNKVDRVITVIEEMTNRLQTQQKIDKPITEISNCIVDINTNALPKAELNETVNLFYSGGLTIYRGLQIVIPAIKILLQRNIKVKLTIAGNGRYKDKLTALTNMLELNNHVTFLGHLDRTQLNIEQQKADVGLIPHLRSVQTDNSSPNKLYEYMNDGLPVVSSDCLSLKRIIEDSKCGICYTHNSPESFANTIENLINNFSKVNFGQNGINAVKTQYNWEKQKHKLTDIYTK